MPSRSSRAIEPDDRGRAVIDVVGEPDRGDPAILQRLAGDLGVGEKALMLDRMAVRRLVEAAFEIGEDEVGRAQFLADPRERHAGSATFIRFTSPTRIIEGIWNVPSHRYTPMRAAHLQ